MATRFSDFTREIEEEARAAGPASVENLARLRAHFRLGRQIFEARKARRLTQKDVAALAGVDEADVSNIERGAANPTLATLEAVVGAVGLELELRPRAPAPQS
jgi:DNA-binding XRE family transcriptional regulator